MGIWSKSEKEKEEECNRNAFRAGIAGQKFGNGDPVTALLFAAGSYVITKGLQLLDDKFKGK